MPRIGFNLGKFDRFVQKILANCRTPYWKPMFRLWGTRYLSDTRRRFQINSRGGGDWESLAPSTIQARRAGRTARKRRTGRGYRKTGPAASSVAILRDTNTLFGALSIGGRGNLFKYLCYGVRVGFDGKVKHEEGGRASIRDIAIFHQKGEGSLPKREILHWSDDTFRRFMRQTLADNIEKIGRRNY